MKQAFERARHIGVVVAGHEADVLGPAESFQKDPGHRPFAGQADIAGVARAGDVVGVLFADVEDQPGQHFHVVHAASAAMPVIPAGQPLAEQLPQLRTRQRTQMRVGQVGEAEHGDPICE